MNIRFTSYALANSFCVLASCLRRPIAISALKRSPRAIRADAMRAIM
jgi:hypothetical protein